MNSNELRQYDVRLTSFCNWPDFSAYFFSVARADRGGSSSFSHSQHNTNTYGPNIFQKMQVKTFLCGRAPLVSVHYQAVMYSNILKISFSSESSHVWGNVFTKHL